MRNLETIMVWPGLFMKAPEILRRPRRPALWFPWRAGFGLILDASAKPNATIRRHAAGLAGFPGLLFQMGVEAGLPSRRALRPATGGNPAPRPAPAS